MIRLDSPCLYALIVAAAITGCGGGGSAESAPNAQELAEGVSPENVLPEDQGFADRSLVPSVLVVVNPGPERKAHAGADWTLWPELLARNVLDVNNKYENSDQALSWPDDAMGIYSSRADCAGYVTRSLMKAFQFTADDFAAWLGSKGPSSARYHDNIVHANNFQRITTASQVRRGDIVAIKYIDKTSGGTGHTMIAAGAAVRRSTPTAPLVENTDQYELRIIDSTSSPHSQGDTRKGTGPNGSDQDGAGLGTVRLYADKTTGVITGYTWSLSSGSSYYTASAPASDRRSLVVGRMTFAD
jgi:hypothetical protein